VCEEDAIYGKRIQVRAEHAAHGAGTEIKDQRLTAGAHHDATLASVEVRDYGAGSYDRDLDGHTFQ